MAATPPSLTTPPPPPTEQSHSSFLSTRDIDFLNSFMPAVMPPNGAHTMNGLGLDGTIVEPLAPPPPNPQPANDQERASGPPAQNGSTTQRAREDEHDGTSSEDDDEDSEDGEAQQEDADSTWYPIFEEKREPVEDELRYWTETPEHSAEDHAYWEGKAFTKLEDPSLQPGASGRIDFAIDAFNGTKEKPNKDTVMRSETVDVGGYTWRLKFYPKGNNTEHLSVYLENVTMQAPDWEATEEFTHPPLPFLADYEQKPRKRRSVAAQVCVVLYNPTEPRQYEHRIDAHQFTKDSPDYGWTRFTQLRRRDLGLRNHFQRAALLQDDKLAFKAYIRVVDDPTGCLWDHSGGRFSTTVSATGLRPFSPMIPMLAADIALLHFAPFRQLVYQWQQEKAPSKFVSWMHILLWKMLSRERSELYGVSIGCEDSDVVAWLQRAVKYLSEEVGAEVTQKLLGTLDADHGAAVGGNRLKTRARPSIQAAVDSHDSPLHTPALLTLELERQYFNRQKREWHRAANKVDIENEVTVGDQKYKLFAFITQHGELSSSHFRTYVRPGGLTSTWYAYSNDKVTCMTHKQVLEKLCGGDGLDPECRERSLSSLGRSRRGTYSFRDESEIAYVVIYVREDYAEEAFRQPKEVDWKAPRYATGQQLDEKAAVVQNETTVVEEKEISQDPNAARTSMSSEGTDYNAGCATPTHWFMDDDGDVVMSEQEDNVPEKRAEGDVANQIETKDLKLIDRKLDYLGCPYYSGQMLGSAYHGQGHLITLSGDEYTGAFSHGQKHGTGKMIYACNGDIYEGEWSDGQRHGRGKYIEASTGNVFDGSWKHDKKSGLFTLTGTVTEEDKGICSICYESEINTAFYDCGHVVACHACSQQIEDCPVCRRRIVSRLQLFGVKVSLE